MTWQMSVFLKLEDWMEIVAILPNMPLCLMVYVDILYHANLYREEPALTIAP